jgi:N-acetylglutamate synthase
LIGWLFLLLKGQEMVIEISKMEIENYEQVYALWQSVEGIGLHKDCDSKNGISAYLERNPGLSFVARDNEKVVGAVLCGHDGRRGYLHHLAIARPYRNKGIGRTLVEHALSVLDSLGIAKCHLFVFSENDDAQTFWQKIGWTKRIDLKVMSKDRFLRSQE